MLRLNAHWRVALREVNQTARRIFFLFAARARRRLYDQMQRIAVLDTLTDEQREGLDRIHWKLGTGSIYRITREEWHRQREMASEIITDLMAREAAERGEEAES